MFLYIVLIGLFSMTFNLPISGSAGRPAGSAFKLDREGMQALDSRLRVYGEGDPEREAAIRAFQVAAQPQMSPQDAANIFSQYEGRVAAGEKMPGQLGVMPEYPTREDGPLWGPGPREDGPLWGPGPGDPPPVDQTQEQTPIGFPLPSQADGLSELLQSLGTREILNQIDETGGGLAEQAGEWYGRKTAQEFPGANWPVIGDLIQDEGARLGGEKGREYWNQGREYLNQYTGLFPQ